MRDEQVEEREETGVRSNQTCCDINTAHGGNLALKIRYDYRESELRGCCSQSNQRLFEAFQGESTQPSP